MRKILKSIILVTLVICSVFTVVLAAERTTAEISAPNEVRVGNTLTVKIPVTGSGDGVNGLQGTLNYDRNVLELINQDTSVDGWYLSGYNDNTGIFLAEVRNVSDKDSFITDKKDLVTFEFRVKDDTEAATTEVSVKDIIASGSASIENTEVSKVIAIVGASGDTNTITNNTTNTTNTVTNNTTNTTNTIVNNTTNVIVNNTTNTNTNSNKTNTNTNTNSNKTNTNTNTNTKTTNNTANTNKNDVANKVIPKTGSESFAAKAVICSVIALVVFYIKYKKLEDVI